MSKSEKVRDWDRILKKWEDGVGTKASFCRENNIPISTFQYHLEKQKQEESKFEFVEVPLLLKEESEFEGIEIRTDYCAISMGKTINRSSLATVLKALKEVSI